MTWKAHTTDDGITTEHKSEEAAKRAARKRQGGGEGQRWQQTELPTGRRVWEDQEKHGRELYALVFQPGDEAALLDWFGLEL